MGGIYDQDGNVTRQQVSEWVLMEAENDHDDSDSDIGECSGESSLSLSSSSDLVEDASSMSTSSSASSSSSGPLYDLSELMAQLPIKRGLSKYYQGKSQSFASLASVESLEDLAKKGNFVSYNKRMKACKSFGDCHRRRNCPKPKATIAKKSSSSRKPFLSSKEKIRENSLLGSFRS